MTMTHDEVARTARAGYALTDDDRHSLRAALKAALLASMIATYKQAGAALRVAGLSGWQPPAEAEQALEQVAERDATSIAETFAANVATQVGAYLEEAQAAGLAALEAIGGLVQSVRVWLREHLAWKRPQIVQATTGAGIDAGTETFADDYTDGDLDLGDDIDPACVEVAVLPEDAATHDICEEYAGNTYPIEDYQLIPDFPVHPNCPHMKIVQYITDEAAQVAA